MTYIGIHDDEFIRGDVPMTKEEIRILTMAKARICPTDVVIDIGAGTGSLTVEAARQAWNGQVYSIERNHDGIELIERNIDLFKLKNVTVLEKEAPDGLDDLPCCNVAIIGGSGHSLQAIIDSVDRLLFPGGRIVVNCVTLQTLYECIAYMRTKADYKYEAVQVQISRLNAVGPYDMMKALNPIFIITCTKKI